MQGIEIMKMVPREIRQEIINYHARQFCIDNEWLHKFAFEMKYKSSD